MYAIFTLYLFPHPTHSGIVLAVNVALKKGAKII